MNSLRLPIDISVWILMNDDIIEELLNYIKSRLEEMWLINNGIEKQSAVITWYITRL